MHFDEILGKPAILALFLSVLLAGCMQKEQQAQPTNCADIVNRPMRGTCYSNMAVAQKDPDICKNIESPNGVGCFQRVAAETGVASICSKMATNLTTGNVANYSSDDEARCTAFVTGSPTYCDKISSLSTRETCIANAAVTSKDASRCENMKFIDPYECVAGVAAAKNDITFCDSYFSQNESNKWGCHKFFAVKTDNSDACDTIGSVSTHDDCYWAMAMFQNKTSLCKKITTRETYISCMVIVSNQ